MGKILVADNYDFRALAIEAGSADPKEIVWDPDDGKLSVPDVTDSALSAAKNRMDTGTAAVSNEARRRKIRALRDAETAFCEGGIQSDPKGTGAVWFDSTFEDQVNLIGNIVAGGTTVHSSRATQGGPKTYQAYTNAELKQVLRDGRDVKLAARQNLHAKVNAAKAATTLAELNAITF